MNATKRIFAALALAAWGIVAQATCVSTIPATTPTADFTVNDDGTVLHQPTGLVWMRCAQGQSWSGGACTGTAASYTWQQALQVAKAVNDGAGYAGQHDWRLPNVKELASIVEHQCVSPSINADVFPNTAASYFWSASADAYYSSFAWGVLFASGYAGDVNKYHCRPSISARRRSFPTRRPSPLPPIWQMPARPPSTA